MSHFYRKPFPAMSRALLAGAAHLRCHCRLSVRLLIVTGSFCACADSVGALLNYEGLARLSEFAGQNEEARAAFRDGLEEHAATSRFLREYGLFEKRRGDLQVYTLLHIFWLPSLLSNPHLYPQIRCCKPPVVTWF